MLAQQIDVGNDIKTEFQQVKTYTSGDSMVTREIKKPVAETIRVYSNNNLRGTANYSVDHTNSLVTFTEGAAALQRFTLRAKVNRSEHEQVPREFMRWVYAGRRKLTGLIRIRQAEAELYCSY